MAALRIVPCLVYFAAAAAFWPQAAAQIPASLQNSAVPDPGSPPRGAWLPGGRSYLGLNVERFRDGTNCAATTLLCDETQRPAEIYTGTMIGNFWGMELGYLNFGRVARGGIEARAQGLNISLVGKAQLAPSLRAFGKVGTTYGRSDTALPGADGTAFGSQQGFGLSVGAGLSLDFTPRLSATLEWDSKDLRSFGGGRDPVRSTSLGLRYSY